MNRAEMLRALAACDATAGAIRKKLKADALAEHAEGTAASWRTTDGAVKAETSLRRDRIEVHDPDEFLAWLVEHKPHMVRQVVEPINPEAIKALLEDWTQDGPMRDETGAVPELEPGGTAQPAVDIPGLTWVKGGTFNSLSVTVEPSRKRRAEAAAAAWIEQAGGGPLDLDRLFAAVYDES